MKRIVLAIIMVASPVLAQAYTRGDIITEIRNQISDTNTDTAIQEYSDAFLHSRIDQAEDAINKLTRCLVTRSTIATTCGTGEYTLPADYVVIQRVMYDLSGSSTTTKYSELSYSTMDQLDRDNAGWEYQSSGTPKNYYYRADKIGLDPAPSLKYSGDYGNIRLDYVVMPTTSIASTASIFNGYPHLQTYKETIISYVCALCMKDEDDATMMNFYWNKFNADIATMIERINNRPDRTGGIKR